jgi:hypothetical protein
MHIQNEFEEIEGADNTSFPLISDAIKASSISVKLGGRTTLSNFIFANRPPTLAARCITDISFP